MLRLFLHRSRLGTEVCTSYLLRSILGRILSFSWASRAAPSLFIPPLAFVRRLRLEGNMRSVQPRPTRLTARKNKKKEPQHTTPNTPNKKTTQKPRPNQKLGFDI